MELVKALYNNFECAVIEESELTEWFKIETGVKQGCNLSGFLFLLVIDWIMRKTVRNGENRIRWKFTTKLDDLDYADDIAMISSTKQQLQEKSNNITKFASSTGLRVNINKCKILRMNARSEEKIKMNDVEIQDVDNFEYLGAYVSKEGRSTVDLNNRITKARTASIRLKNVWSSNNISAT